MGHRAVRPVGAIGDLGAIGTEVAFRAFDIQVVTGAAFHGAIAVEIDLVLVEPTLAGGMDVAIMACRRPVVVFPAQCMADSAGRTGLGQTVIGMRDDTVTPGSAGRHLGSFGIKMAFLACDIQVVTTGAVNAAVAVELRLVLIKPLLAHGVDVAIVAFCRAVAV